MDEVVALGLILELQQRGAESIDLIIGQLGKFDDVLEGVDAAIGSLDGRISAMETAFGGLTPAVDAASLSLSEMGGGFDKVGTAASSSMGAIDSYAGGIAGMSDLSYEAANALIAENDALRLNMDGLMAAAQANEAFSMTKLGLATSAGAAAEGLGVLTGAEVAEGEASLQAAGSNDKLKLSKEEIAAAAEAAKSGLLDLGAAEGTEADESLAAAGANQKLTLSKEELAAEAALAAEQLQLLQMAEGEEAAESTSAASANQRLAGAKGEVASAAQLAAVAERELAEAELLEAFEAIKDAGATDALFMSKTQLINASRLEAATEAEVAEAELLEAMAIQVDNAARLAEIETQLTEIATLELLAALEIEVADTTSLLAASNVAAGGATLGFAGAMDALAGSMGAVNGAGILSFFGGVKDLAVDVAEALGIVAVAGGIADVAAVKWASDFQDSMIKVEALSGVTHDQMLTYSDDILAMSQNTDVSAKKMGDALYFISTGAYKGAAALDVLDVSQKAAAAGLGQTKVVADAVTSALTAYHKPTADAAHVTDVLIQAVIEGKAEADSFAGAMGRFLPIMAAAGISLEEGSASMATMTRVGLSAEESATALRQSINNLVAPTNQARKEMAALGLSTDDVRKMIQDKGLLGTYRELIALTHGDMDAIRELIPNIRAMTGVLAELGPEGDAYADVLANIRASTGATDKAFEVAQGAISFQIGRMINDIKSIGIEIGDELIPMLNPKIHQLGDWFIEQSHGVATFMASMNALSEDTGMDKFTALLNIAGRSIGENFGPEAESKFDHITQVIGDLAEGAGTAFSKILDFVQTEILPIPDNIAAIFSTEGGMAKVLDTLGLAAGALAEKIGSWVEPAAENLANEKLPLLQERLGSWFETEGPVLERRVTEVWVPAAVKWAEVAAADLVTDKLPKLATDIGEWSITRGVPALVIVGANLAEGIVKGLSDGLVEIVPNLLHRALVEPAQKIVKDVQDMVYMIQTGDLNPKYDPSDPYHDRKGAPGPQDRLKELGNNQDQYVAAGGLERDSVNANIDAAITYMNHVADLVDDTTADVAAASHEIEAARADMNTHAPTGHSKTARELAEEEAARKKAEAAAKKAADYAAAHDPLGGLMQGLRDNKQNYIDEYGKLGGALASSLDESLYAGTTAAGKKVAAALEADIGALRAAEIPEWRALGDELADAIYGAMADPKNTAALENAQAEIGKINAILEQAANEKQAAKFWDEWGKGSEEASNKINAAIDAATGKIEKAHEKAATAAQAAWDKLNLSRELDAAHSKIETLMKDYETLHGAAKIDQSRGREDTATEQGRENSIADLQEKRIESVSDAEAAHERALADLRAAHVVKLGDIRKDASNKHQAVDIAKENEKFGIEQRNLTIKWERENTDRTTKWEREDSARATSWSREDARRTTQRAQQDADRAQAYSEADALKAYKLSLEQQLGIDKDTLREQAYQKDLEKIGLAETTAVQAAIDDVGKITAAAETKLDELWAKLTVKYKGLFKAVTGGDQTSEEEGAVGKPGTDYSDKVGSHGDTGSYVVAADQQVTAHNKIIRAIDDEADSEDDLNGTLDEVTGAQREASMAADEHAGSLDKEGLATDDVTESYDEMIARLNAANAAETVRTNAIRDQIIAQGLLAAAYAKTQEAATNAAKAQAASAAIGSTGTLGNQGGGSDGTGGNAHDMSHTIGYPIGFADGYAQYEATHAGYPPGFNPNIYQNPQYANPKMAKGGIAEGPMNVEIGDAGPEAVIPLAQLPSMMGELGKGGGDWDYAKMAQEFVKAFAQNPVTAVMDPVAAAGHLAGPLFDGVRDNRWSFTK